MAMTKEEIQTRINKKEVEIEKINKRISKWSTGLSDEAINLCIKYGMSQYDDPNRKIIASEWRQYKLEHERELFNQVDWNKGPNYDETMRAYSDLRDAQATLDKYKVQLDKLINYENEDKVQVLVDFLNDWGNKAYSWYMENAKKYFELKRDYSEKLDEYMYGWDDEHPEPEDDSKYNLYKRMRRNAADMFYQEYYAPINELTKTIVRLKSDYVGPDRKYTPVGYVVDEEKLTKFINDEKKRKYEDLVRRITAVVGQIQDVANLSIGNQSGEINGYVIGDKGKAKVQTISAGGYAIQCFHYRVLVNKY